MEEIRAGLMRYWRDKLETGESGRLTGKILRKLTKEELKEEDGTGKITDLEKTQTRTDFFTKYHHLKNKKRKFKELTISN